MSKALLDDIEGSLSKVLSYFSLTELAEIRKASPNLQNACQRRKEYIHSLLAEGVLVEIVGLTSERGKQLNSRVATVNGSFAGGRYPLKIQHITGKVENVSVKPQNINPFLTPEQEVEEKSRLDFVNYSSDAKVREGHGRLLDQVLMLLRFAVNVMGGYSHYQGEFDDFMSLPRAHQGVAMANVEVFTMYRVKPSTAGYRVPGDMSILDSTIHSLAESEESASQLLGKMAKYDKDGSDGELIVRNMVRFMQVWDKERVSGEFWITKIVRTGTLVVQKVEGEKLGNVYLVKGVGSQVGGQVPAAMLPILVRTTFLPMYDMLVYDEIMLGVRTPPLSQSFKDKINQHVTKAVREQKVIYCGESAARGLWNTDPPKIVKPVPSDEPTKKNPIPDNSDSYEPTPEQLRMATKIVKWAKKHDFKASKSPEKSLLVVRRMGYTKEDNPMQLVGLMYQRGDLQDGIDPFRFETWPTYTLDEVLSWILKKVKKVGAMPGLIWVDEKSLVVPLRECLRKASNAVELHEEVEIDWYPPPSEEEQAYHERYGLY